MEGNAVEEVKEEKAAATEAGSKQEDKPKMEDKGGQGKSKEEDKKDKDKEKEKSKEKKKQYKTDEDLLLAFRFFDKNGEVPMVT